MELLLRESFQGCKRNLTCHPENKGFTTLNKKKSGESSFFTFLYHSKNVTDLNVKNKNKKKIKKNEEKCEKLRIA